MNASPTYDRIFAEIDKARKEEAAVTALTIATRAKCKTDYVQILISAAMKNGVPVTKYRTKGGITKYVFTHPIKAHQCAPILKVPKPGEKPAKDRRVLRREPAAPKESAQSAVFISIGRMFENIAEHLMEQTRQVKKLNDQLSVVSAHMLKEHYDEERTEASHVADR